MGLKFCMKVGLAIPYLDLTSILISASALTSKFEAKSLK